MFGNRSNKKKKVVDTIISEGTVIEGKINHETSLRVDGKVYGEIACDGDVYIGKSGYAENAIEANNIIISGEVDGNIHAKDKVHIQPSGKLSGSVKTTGLVIDDGGTFNGESIITSDEKESKKLKSTPNETKQEVVQE